MPTLILDGRAAREARIPELAARIKQLIKPPHIAIVQVGDRADTASYIRAKTAFAAKIGAKVKHIHLKESASQQELLDAVATLNADADVNGIVVQLPLPPAIDRDAVIDALAPHKDVDGLSAINIKGWLEGRDDAILPATARGVRELLAHYRISVFGKHVVIVGRSMLVGKPIAAFALNENATVTVVHSKTPNLAEITSTADILIVAAGRPRLITADHVREGAVVIDVGINTLKGDRLEDEVEGAKLVGDVDFEAVKAVLGDGGAITPVPGGVGPMTVLGLFENLADLCQT